MTRITHESVVDREDGGTYHLMSTLDNATHALNTHQARMAEIAARAQSGDPQAAERLEVLGEAIGRLIESTQAIQDQATI